MSEKNFNVISRCAPWTCTLVCLLVCNLKKNHGDSADKMCTGL